MPPKPSATPDHVAIRSGLIWLVVAFLVVTALLLLFRAGNETAERPSTPDRNPSASASSSRPSPARSSTTAETRAIIDRLVLAPDTTKLSADQLIAQLLDESLPLKTRRQAARALAQIGSDEALAALKKALASGPPYLKAAIAESLGQSPHPESQKLLLELLNGRDEIAARGAARGLALRGDAESAQALADLLFNSRRPASVRTEAALALGEIQRPEAQETLVKALAEIDDERVVESVLEGLAKRPFAEVQDVFRKYLESDSVPAELKVSAIEALQGTEGNVTPFLLKYLSDANPDIRAAAAWALSASANDAGPTTEIGPQVTAALKRESDARVRARLYEVLAGQDNPDVPAILGLVQTESEVNARLAGFICLAGMLRSSATPDVSTFFNQIAVPELKNTALLAKDPEFRLLSVIALRRAKTADSLNALREIAGTSRDPKIIEAAQAAVQSPVRR